MMAATLKRRRTDLSTIHELHGETGAVVKLTGIRELWEREKFTDLVLQAKCDGTSSPSRLKHIINCVQYFHPVSSSDFRGLLELLSSKDLTLLVTLSWIFVFIFSMVSLAFTSKMMVFQVSFFTKSFIPPRRRRTKCRVDSFWIL